MSARPLVLMMAGGTGGHVYPALAVAQELLERGFRVEWMGTERGLEARVVPAAGIKLHCLSVRGVRGKDLWHKLSGILYLLLAAMQALWLVLRLSPRCVVGMGGYAAGPGGVAAWLLRKPLVVHEQNAVAGTTNRMLAPLASSVMTGFPTDFKKAVVSEVVGNPLRRELLEAGGQWSYQPMVSSLRLLVLGGSLGAKPINELVPAAARALLAARGDHALEIRHQSGEAHAEDVETAYGELLGTQVQVMPFVEDMAGAYEWADLVLCRAGALTVSELAAMGRPSVLVPLPHAIDDHQSANARYLSNAGAALLVPQQDLSEDRLATLLAELMDDPGRLTAMARAAHEVAMPAATRTVSQRCEELAHGQ